MYGDKSSYTESEENIKMDRVQAEENTPRLIRVLDSLQSRNRHNGELIHQFASSMNNLQTLPVKSCSEKKGQDQASSGILSRNISVARVILNL